MTVDPLDHMEEAWNLDGNPFPAEAIRAQNPQQNQPYSPAVFDEESREFRRKLIRSSVRGSVNVGFLWSQGAQADTGFGKTTLMQEVTKEINRDLGVDTLTKAGVRPEKQTPIAAAYSNLNNLNASGLYPVLFNAVTDLVQPSEAGVAVLADIHFGSQVEGDGEHVRFSYASSFEAIDDGLSRIADFIRKNKK